MRMSENLMWVPDRCQARISTNIAPIGLRRSSENYISPSGKYLTLRGNFISATPPPPPHRCGLFGLDQNQQIARIYS